jgi:hypothetical protein
MCQVSGLIDGEECCTHDGECSLTVEAEMMQEACTDVADAAKRLSEIVVEHDRRDDDLARPCTLLLWSTYVDVQQAIATLTQAIVIYSEPDAGMEPV